MSFERLSGDYNRGYTQAIQDIMENYEACENDLKRGNKRLTSKLTKKFLKCFLENKAILREKCGGFIFYNLKEEQFKCGIDKNYGEE